MLPPWITPAQYDALRRVTAALDALGHPWVASGGLAGNLHGSAWPLHDVDLDVPRAALPDVARAFAPCVRFGPAAYADGEFALELLTLDVGGTGVDLSAAESVVLVAPDGTHHAAPTDLAAWVPRPLGDLVVRAMPLAALVAYKRRIGRAADVADLERLAP